MISASSLQLLAADTSAGAARALADKVIAALGPLESLDLTFRNLSSLDTQQAAEAWKTVENEFRSRGIRLAREPDATAKISLALSENLQNSPKILDKKNPRCYQGLLEEWVAVRSSSPLDERQS